MFTDDMANEPDQLFGAFILATVGNATIRSMNTTDALVL